MVDAIYCKIQYYSYSKMFSANNKTHNYIERDPNESVEDLEVDMQFFYNELAPKNSEAIYRQKDSSDKEKLMKISNQREKNLKQVKNASLSGKTTETNLVRNNKSKNTTIIHQMKRDTNSQAEESYLVRKKNKDKKQNTIITEKHILSSNDYSYYQESPILQQKLPQRKKNVEVELGVTRIIHEMKKQKNPIDNNWEQMESLLRSKRKQETENVGKTHKRESELENARDMLSGKVSIIWIFVISAKVNEENKKRIKKMYSGLTNQKYIVPFCKQSWQIKAFLQIPNSFFKIVSDLKNIKDILHFKNSKKVIQIYIYNEKMQKGISTALNYKVETRKIKGIYTDLQKIVDRAEEQIQNQIQLFLTKNGLSKRKKVKVFPSFIKLSGEDKTYATLYRANLYGAKNLLKNEKKQRFENFMSLVKQKYNNVDKQKQNIQDYIQIDHFTNVYDLNQARKIIQFYVRQSFYYEILNSMLRTMKTTQEFKPCILPFNETYHSIKMFYTQDLIKAKRKIKYQTLYRGAKLRKRDFNSLKTGTYIEMLGFMSTSKKLERAKEFTDKDGYIIIIEVPELEIKKKLDSYDHGFVDINKHSLASQKFSIEEEVLFNALNIYKVKDITVDEEGYTYIRIEYGVIFSLLEKKKKEMTVDEKDILVNYQFCSSLLSQIEDQGDVHLFFNEFQDSKEYYLNKLKGEQNEKDSGKYYYKLANAQQQCGQLEQADSNAKKSLQIQMKSLDLKDHEKCMKVFSIHSKNAQISLQKEDYLVADEALNRAIDIIPEDNDFEKAKKLRERGQVKFKKGQINAAENDFFLSETIFRNLSEKAQQKRSKIKTHYYLSFLTLWCSSLTKQQLEEQKTHRMKEIQQFQQKIGDMKQTISDELIKVNNSLREVAQYAQDKDKYEICVKKARAYLLQIKSRQTNDPSEKAKLKVLQATVQDYLQLAQSQKLLHQAIKLVQSTDPYNEEVGKYSTILAQLQKQDLQKFSNPKYMKKNKLNKLQPIQYNEKEHKEIADRSRNNFQKAINVLLFNNKPQGSPEVMSVKNQLGQLNYNECEFESSEKIIKEVKAAGQNKQHSEISKSCLILSKIGYARGQLKYSFENIEQADEFLRKAIVKQQQQKYIQIYKSSQTYLQVKMHRAKIYHKQLKHDLSLKDLQTIQSTFKSKFNDYESHSLFADVYQLRGQNYVEKKQIYDFDQFFHKAIKLREKQMGEYNIGNAIAYCNYGKYLCLIEDYKEAQIALNKAVQIFSCFSQEHPITWIVHYCFGFYNQRKLNNTKCLQMLQNCLAKAENKFDKTHITLNKIRYQYGKALHRSGRIEDAINEFEALQNNLQKEIGKSSKRFQVKNETDDEKIALKKFLYSSLRDTYRLAQSINDSFLLMSKSGIEKCDKKLNELQITFSKSNLTQK